MLLAPLNDDGTHKPFPTRDGIKLAQERYNAFLSLNPTYKDSGRPRKTWAQLTPLAQLSWME